VLLLLLLLLLFSSSSLVVLVAVIFPCFSLLLSYIQVFSFVRIDLAGVMIFVVVVVCVCAIHLPLSFHNFCSLCIAWKCFSVSMRSGQICFTS
jgi:hypothetical protein